MALAYREERLLRSAALRIRARLQDGIDSFAAVTQVQDHLVTLARAHVERVIFDHFAAAVSSASAEPLRDALRPLAALFALSRLEADRGWYLESGYLEGGKARAVREAVGELCREVSASAPLLVDAFGIPEALLPPLVAGPAPRLELGFP